MVNYEKYGRKYYLKNKEKIQEYRKKWIAEHPEQARELQKRATKNYLAKKKKAQEEKQKELEESYVMAKLMKEIGDAYVENPMPTQIELDMYQKYGILPSATNNVKQRLQSA